ncbi:sulfatase [Mariniflexile gromovii]|uniref:Sulfatase-like hydrolase/transferase n=1 Tax=Mariniflexile gromovii TaxID=362523 RepID=A0ABS4BTZ3_9FLAO|nr:sulfatase-like hydrolase/transferase [Mariniflexile gromovii]MBP0904049.1 sulfatase-like hydrolase/transferase [Mariniflexile gromovii]
MNNIIKTIALLLVWSFQSNHAQSVKTTSENKTRPNILLIISDQHSGRVMSQVGYKHVNTPGIDKLADEGVTFTRSYCTYPVCMASRASLMTGYMPNKSNSNLMAYNSIGKTLKETGYTTAYFGKWHVSNSKIKEVEDWHGFETYKQEYNDTKTAKLSTDFISQKHDKPFFLVTSLLNPHDCCELARNISGLGDDYHDGAVEENKPIEECPPLPVNFKIPENEAEGFYTRRTPDSTDKVNFGKHPVKYWEEQEWRQYMYGYDRLVEKMDDHILTIVNTLENQGLLENTIIFYTSDHGDGHGSHEWNQKMTFYEESINVPFVISWKGHTKSGVIDSKTLTSNGLDLYPTICKMAGVIIDESLPGENLSAYILKDAKQPKETRKYVVSELNQKEENKPKGREFVGRMVVTENYKYFLFDGGEHPEQFFDVKNDPEELKPLIYSKEHQKEIAAHRNMLKEWIKKTGDDFPIKVIPK